MNATSDATPSALAALLNGQRVWRGAGTAQAVPPDGRLTTGFAALDAVLPWEGWPAAGLVEILGAARGVGELSLLLPALAARSTQDRPVLLVAPPYRPYAPAWQRAGVRLSRLHVLDAVPTEALWAMEQALRAGCCGAVLGWPLRAEARALRRLQVAAETGQTPGFLFQAPEAAHNPSPAPLRLQLEHVPAGLALRILKCRGRPPPAAAILLVADQQDGAPERAGSPRFPARPPAPARDPVTGKHALALLSPPFSSGTQRLSPRSRDSGRGGA